MTALLVRCLTMTAAQSTDSLLSSGKRSREPPSEAPSETQNASGSSSVVEHYLAKVGVASSSLVSR
jgi:hypothetical protein